jgi:hypothetical protein
MIYLYVRRSRQIVSDSYSDLLRQMETVLNLWVAGAARVLGRALRIHIRTDWEERVKGLSEDIREEIVKLLIYK